MLVNLYFLLIIMNRYVLLTLVNLYVLLTRVIRFCFLFLLFFRVAVNTSVLDRNIHYLNIIMTIHMAYLIVTKFYKKVIYYFHRLFYINCRNTGSYLGSECNFGFMQIPYFGRQVTIWAWSAQPSLISELPLQLRSRRNRSAV